MLDFFDKLSEPIKGIILLVFGTLCILYTFGFFVELFGYVLLTIAIVSLLVGFVKIGGMEKIRGLFKKKQ